MKIIIKISLRMFMVVLVLYLLSAFISPLRTVLPDIPVLGAVGTLREKYNTEAILAYPGREAAVMIGLTTGDDSYFSPEDKYQFRQMGISHVTAISGANFSMLLGLVAMILKPLRRYWRYSGLLGIGWCYLHFVGSDNLPALRAFIFLSLQLCFLALGRKISALVWLPLAFFIIYIVDAAAFTKLSLQLSLCAWAVIRLVLPKIDSGQGVISMVGAEIAASFLGTLLLLPVSLFFFKEVNLYAPVLNMILVPLFSLIFLISVITFLPFLLIATTNAVVTELGLAIVTLVLAVVDTLSSWNWQLTSGQGALIYSVFTIIYFYKLVKLYRCDFAQNTFEKLHN